MSIYQVSKTRIQAGIWEGIVKSTDGSEVAPNLLVSHLGEPIQSMAVTQDADAQDSWQLRIAIPPELLTDGAQVFIISDKDSGESLSSFSIITGEPLEDDIRAEVELLRAELDMLKRAFRRHYKNSAGC